MVEAKEMIKEIRAERGRPFDIEHLMMSSVANVVVGLAVGRRFDYSDAEFQQLISDSSKVTAKIPVELELFPLLRSLPYYKRKMTEIGFLMQRVSSFVNSKIAFCRQVVTCTVIYYLA